MLQSQPTTAASARGSNPELLQKFKAPSKAKLIGSQTQLNLASRTSSVSQDEILRKRKLVKNTAKTNSALSNFSSIFGTKSSRTDLRTETHVTPERRDTLLQEMQAEIAAQCNSVFNLSQEDVERLRSSLRQRGHAGEPRINDEYTKTAYSSPKKGDLARFVALSERFRLLKHARETKYRLGRFEESLSFSTLGGHVGQMGNLRPAEEMVEYLEENVFSQVEAALNALMDAVKKQQGSIDFFAAYEKDQRVMDSDDEEEHHVNETTGAGIASASHSKPITRSGSTNALALDPPAPIQEGKPGIKLESKQSSLADLLEKPKSRIGSAKDGRVDDALKKTKSRVEELIMSRPQSARGSKMSKSVENLRKTPASVKNSRSEGLNSSQNELAIETKEEAETNQSAEPIEASQKTRTKTKVYGLIPRDGETLNPLVLLASVK